MNNRNFLTGGSRGGAEGAAPPPNFEQHRFGICLTLRENNAIKNNSLRSLLFPPVD